VKRAVIRDEFTDLPISRQRKYQLRMKREKRCQLCGAPVAKGSYCLKHWIEQREFARRKFGCKRRNYNALSYLLEAKAGAGVRKKRSYKVRSFDVVASPAPAPICGA
jgi:hypothetical protein